jgi:hypothetical protein
MQMSVCKWLDEVQARAPDQIGLEAFKPYGKHNPSTRSRVHSQFQEPFPMLIDLEKYGKFSSF